MEPFAGSGALSLQAVLGLPHGLVPYLGSKRRYADVLLRLLGPDVRRVGRAVLGGLGPVAMGWEAVLGEGGADVRDRMLGWGDGSRARYRELQAAAETDPAAWLWCAARAFRPGEVATGWKEPADVLSQVSRIGRIHIGRSALEFRRCDALALLATCGAGDIVYCDPPYPGTTGYDVDVDRGTLLAELRAAADRGAVCLLSGHVPGAMPGWWDVEITGTGAAGWAVPEWVAMSRAPAVDLRRVKQIGLFRALEV